MTGLTGTLPGVPLSVVDLGSHMWRMNHAASDRDYYCLWAVTPRKLFDGSYSEAQRSHRTRMVAHDYPNADPNSGNRMEATEVAHEVHLLLDSNINAIQRTLSSEVFVVSSDFLELRTIVATNRAKNIYDSVNGMNSANLKRYWNRLAEDGPEFGTKKAGQILRVVDCAVRVLEGKPYTFEPVVDPTFEKCVESLETLKRAYENSTLPERPDEQVYRDYLFDLRIRHLDGIL